MRDGSPGGDPAPAPSGPATPSWVKPNVVRDAVFDAYSDVVTFQSHLPRLPVPEFHYEHAEGLVVGIEMLIDELSSAISTNALLITGDVGATVDAVLEADSVP